MTPFDSVVITSSRTKSNLSTKTDRNALSDFTFWSWENLAPTDLRDSIQMPGRVVIGSQSV
jgi:hypothetical protein